MKKLAVFPALILLSAALAFGALSAGSSLADIYCEGSEEGRRRVSKDTDRDKATPDYVIHYDYVPAEDDRTAVFSVTGPANAVVRLFFLDEDLRPLAAGAEAQA